MLNIYYVKWVRVFVFMPKTFKPIMILRNNDMPKTRFRLRVSVRAMV